ncbi:MAG: histidine--tRNA ligase [Alphaproteobacteria bacterium]|nr:histidine--tRNA ligase [Alphaproteobacteria bacterium]
MSKPPPRLQARSPRGFQDLSGHAVRARTKMIATIREVYDRYGFEPLETPALEYVDALGKFLPEQDRPDEGIFALKDTDEQWIALRYDLTAPLSRFVAQMGQDLVLPYRRYQVGSVWRNEKPGPGRFREFTQFDIDTIGTASPAADAENCAVLAEALEALGLKRGEFIVKINTRRLLDGVMERIGLQPGSADPQSLCVLRAIDKFDRVGIEGVRLLLTSGRKDESGDFTKGAGLSAQAADIVLDFMQAGQASRGETLSALARAVANAPSGRAGLDELEAIDRILANLGIDEGRAIFDPGIVRGLAYYTGAVLEAAITIEITDDEGRRRQIGSVAGGGRYDGLISRFTGTDIPATGVSIGVDRLMTALSLAGRIGASQAEGPVVVTVFDKSRMADYQRIAAELRAAGIRAEVFLGEGGLKAQLRYADRRGAPVAVIAGGDEFAAGTVSLKDLIAGRALSAEVAGNEQWREKSRAQVTVPRGELVAQVKAILQPPA